MDDDDRQEPAFLGNKSNSELLSLMAVKIASLHLLAETGSPLLRANIIDALSHLNSLYDRLLDDPRIMKDVGTPIVDRLRKKPTRKPSGVRRAQFGLNDPE